jgi:hypothetical protein
MGMKQYQNDRNSTVSYLNGFDDNHGTLGLEIVRRKIQRRQRPLITETTADIRTFTKAI